MLPNIIKYACFVYMNHDNMNSNKLYMYLCENMIIDKLILGFIQCPMGRHQLDRTTLKHILKQIDYSF